jgi:hypothetical protein
MCVNLSKSKGLFGRAPVLQKQLRLWLLWRSGFSDGAEAVLENVWQNGFTYWIEVVKSPNCPFLFFVFFLFYPFLFFLFLFPFLFSIRSFLSIHAPLHSLSVPLLPHGLCRHLASVGAAPHLHLASAGAPPHLPLASVGAAPCLRLTSASAAPRHATGLPLHLDAPRAATARPSPPPRRATARAQLHPSLLLPAATAVGATRGHSLEKGGRAGWSHKNVAPPPLWKPRGAPSPAPHPEPVRFHRLAGLRAEPLVELLMEPCQTGPN